MKPVTLFSLLLAFLPHSFAATNLTLAPDDKLVTTVAAFLQSQNVTNLAFGLAPSIADWEAELQRLGRTPSAEQRSKLEQSHDNDLRNLTRSGEHLLQQARRFGILSANASWTLKHAGAVSVHESSYDRIHETFKETMPSAREIRLTFLRESTGQPKSALNGEYTIDLQFATRFPTGWRISNGLKWALFPPGVVSANLHADMVLAASLPPYGGNLTNEPALRDLGEKVLTFLTKKDPAYFAAELIHPLDLLYKLREERAPDEKLPPKAEMEKVFASWSDEWTGSARAVLAEMERLGLDFTQARIKEVIADDVEPQNAAGFPQSFGAKEIFITFSIPEITAAADRKIPAGDYVLASARADRMAGRWYLQKIRWLSFPKGVLSDEDIARQEFENYVAKHRRLPPGTPAPDIELLHLNGSGKSRLSDYRGKIVALEWWATWCGPCQEPMAKLQKIAEARQDWRGKVELITVSIDDDSATPAKHLETRGWTNTLNTWAGGDWSSAAAKAFRVSAVPSFYLISPEGKIIESGRGTSPWGNTVDELLKTEPSRPTR